MKKLSIKLGILFFIIIFGLEAFMFSYLHSSLVNVRIEEELSALQARGNSHRDILEKHFEEDSISHVILMESEALTDVVIVNQKGDILGTSFDNDNFKKYLIQQKTELKSEGKVVEDDWKNKPYIITLSPIMQKNETIGYVYMYQETASIHALIGRLNEHFVLAGIIALLLTFVVIVLLTRALTKPLVKMKEATYQISKGNFLVDLPRTSNDELGELAVSIKELARDLNFLKKERNDFLASISHELRTPLTYIKGYADISLRKNIEEEEKEKYLQIIVEESNRLSSLIEDLFELAKIDKNTFLIQKQQINLNELLVKLQIKMLPAFKEKEIDLTIFCPKTTSFYGDPARMEQILFNLLDNAMKYSPVRSKVEVIVRFRKKETEITIKDNGKGIPEEDLPYIFNRFYRVDKSRTRSLGGYGLGLSIVQELVQAQEGTIRVESKLNIGTTFILSFKNLGGEIK
ncbi:sensor histidine kinase [Bacillus sp. MB2021]|uniref:sensor histidine kinase n=2 Tax=unclassified Bacillus (in: firmicutes) TaxID=185979 RepID=UPI0004E162E2|nr:ATP-binding protein [Bacillus sp. MB2021]